MALVQQETIYFFVNRVSRLFAAYDARKFVKVCLKTDSESEALRKVAEVEDNLEQYWIALSDGSGEEAKYDATVKLASARGVRYRPEKELMSRGLDEVLRRIEALEPNEAKDPVVSGSVLGVVKRPTVKLSEINEMVFELEKTKLVGKSEDQIRRYKNPKLKAFKNLIGLLGGVGLEYAEKFQTIRQVIL